MKARKKQIASIFGAIAIALAALVVAIFLWPNTNHKITIKVTEDTPTDAFFFRMEQDSDGLKSSATLLLASKLVYHKVVKPGKYVFDKRTCNVLILWKIRRGSHYPVKFSFGSVRTKSQLISKLSKYDFLFEWSELSDLMEDKRFLARYGLAPETAISAFRPDTYELYYDISAEEFFDKMYSYYDKLWSEKRLADAHEIGLSPLEVMTLASIVEEENYRDFEKPRIAGLYMNRLHKNMLLQSDPTVKFAIGDFTLKRILSGHLRSPSPYNTYIYKGLPPGPIRIPATSSIDAVLHYEHHKYLYMCAKEDFSGAHNFAVTYAEHQKNARKYQRALNERGIK